MAGVVAVWLAGKFTEPRVNFICAVTLVQAVAGVGVLTGNATVDPEVRIFLFLEREQRMILSGEPVVLVKVTELISSPDQTELLVGVKAVPETLTAKAVVLLITVTAVVAAGAGVIFGVPPVLTTCQVIV